MPYLHMSTNAVLSSEQRSALLARGTELVSSALGKPADYVMVHVHDGQALVFAGSPEPAAIVELASLGFPEDRSAELSGEICQLLNEVADIPASRIYIDFRSPPRHMWGYDGRTFG